MNQSKNGFNSISNPALYKIILFGYKSSKEFELRSIIDILFKKIKPIDLSFDFSEEFNQTYLLDVNEIRDSLPTRTLSGHHISMSLRTFLHKCHSKLRNNNQLIIISSTYDTPSQFYGTTISISGGSSLIYEVGLYICFDNDQILCLKDRNSIFESKISYSVMRDLKIQLILN